MRKWVLTLILLLLIGGLAATSAVVVQSQAPAPAVVAGHGVLGRPIPNNRNVRVDLGFPYGWHRRNTSPIHHGVDIGNPTGTPVIAAADGTVVFAGADSEVPVGLYPNFYGNVVIIQHDFSAPEGGAVFTLYGHMRTIDPAVTNGVRVARGQQIGSVGMTGIAIGPHLHFEVRVGDPFNYNAVRNPELWLEPLPGTGTLIGRMKDMNGNMAMGVRYVIANRSMSLPGFTYADPAIPVDPSFGENFAMTDLRAGCYVLRVRGAFESEFCINPGETLLYEFQLTR
jgi:hypothetical protein